MGREERHGSFVADGQGEVRISINRDGLWNLRGVYVVEAQARSGANWDTHWATAVFLVGR
jgi:hypothetical protein